MQHSLLQRRVVGQQVDLEQLELGLNLQEYSTLDDCSLLQVEVAFVGHQKGGWKPDWLMNLSSCSSGWNLGLLTPMNGIYLMQGRL